MTARALLAFAPLVMALQPVAGWGEDAQQASDTASTGDAEYGAYLSGACATCHRTDGSDQGIPSIVGWHEEDFVAVMTAYKQGLLPHAVMQMLASRLSDEEIAALAAYYASLKTR